jgi:hypothetical protein
MAIDDPRAAVSERSVLYVQWGPIFAGAVAVAALALVLHSFAGAIGVSVSSTAPTWRDASTALILLSGIYLILVALASYGLGGYVAGRRGCPSVVAPRTRSSFATARTGSWCGQLPLC